MTAPNDDTGPVTVCAWCPKEPEPDGADTVLRVSHGICQSCADKFEADARASETRRILATAYRRFRGLTGPACQIRGGL